jgi:uncharacterized protein Yka (UPF0111/DUF47 family)
MLDNVIPKRAHFFALLGAHTDRVVAGANATLRLITGLGAATEPPEALIDEVNLDETSADDIKAQFIRLLYESFTTPISRDQLHTLILDLDRVLDTLQSVANAIRMYHIGQSTPEARTMASLGADACLRLNRAVNALAERKRAAEVVALCREIDAIETRSSQVMREAVTRLFEREGDEDAAWQAMKLRGFYFAQEAVVDHCKRAAHTIEEILLENA